MNDPRRRPDSLCALSTCRKPLKPPSVKQRGVDPAVYASEPFCSSKCCREWYGTGVELPLQGRPRVYVGPLEKGAA